MTRIALGAALIGCVVVLAVACAPAPRLSPAAGGRGSWTISGHRMPGVSAMTDADAAPWHGRAVRLDGPRATNGVDSCDAPAYVELEHAAAAFLDVEYRVRPADLGLGANAQVHVIDVACGEQPWLAVGSRILVFDGGRTFTVWDGVFFELTPVRP